MLKIIFLGTILSIVSACGGGGGGGSTTPTELLKGTAASGAAILGQVTVKDSLGAVKSAPIDVDTGAYSVDVSGLTPPFILRAKGTVGGRQVQYHSYATDADIDGTVNITPFTDLIVANAAQQLASSYFDSITVGGPPPTLNEADIEAQETALQAKLQAVFDVVGVGAAVDLLHTAFSADRTGLDAVLDVVRIEPDPSAPTTQVFIKNLIDNTQLADAVNNGTDGGTLSVTSLPTVYTTQATDRQQIAQFFADFSALFSAGLPTANLISAKLTPDFLDFDMSGAQFATDLSTDSSLRGVTFAGLEIGKSNTDGTASVRFHIVTNGKIDPEPGKIWVKKVAGVWKLHGNQEIVDRWDGFFCQQYIDTQTTRSCGLWLGADDLDFNNNGTGSAPIASARVTLMRKDSMGVLMPVMSGGNNVEIFMGVPTGGAAGELRIYDQDYSDDAVNFGITDLRAQLDPALLQAGDQWQFELYTAALDLSAVNSPAVTGTAVVTYLSPLRYMPHSNATTAAYPTATDTTLAAFAEFTGGNLKVAASVPAGQVFNEVYLQVCDTTTCVESDNFGLFDPTGETVVLDLSSLDQNAMSYTATLRVYSVDENGQGFLSQYPKSIPGPAATPTTPPPSSGLACNYQSGWDDTLSGGLGAPIKPNSFADYESVVAACGTAQTFTVSDVSTKTFQEVVTGPSETLTFNAGTGTVSAPATGTFDDGTGFTFTFHWWVEAATCTGCSYSYLVVYSNTTIDPNLPLPWIRETSALTGISGTPGAVGTQYSYVKYSEQSNYSDTTRASGSDGEIWNSVDAIQ